MSDIRLLRRLPLVAGLCALGLVSVAATRGPRADNGLIAFTRYRLQDTPLRSEIWVARPDGSNARKVSRSSTAVEDDQAQWSPDGTWIAFARCTANHPCSVWLVHPDGTGQHRVRIPCASSYGCDDAGPSFTPDGRHILIQHEWGRVKHLNTGDEIAHSAIATADLTGGNLKILHQLPAYAGDLQAPRVSPDGRQLVFDRYNAASVRPAGGDAIFVADLTGTASGQLTPWRMSAGSPDWSPDGKQILFKSFIAGAGELTPGTNLYTINSDGTGLRRVTHVGQSHYVLAGSFSPDGTSIVFATDESATPNPRGGTFADVFTMQLGDNVALPVTRSANLDGWPSWGRRSRSG